MQDDNIQVEINLEDVNRLYDNVVSSIKNNALYNAIGNEALDLLRDQTPRKSGEMASSWRFLKVGDTVLVTNEAPHAKFVVEGTRPHEIRPKSSNVLAFQVKGNMIFAKRVMHPGTKPNDFIDRILDTIDLTNIAEMVLRGEGVF